MQFGITGSTPRSWHGVGVDQLRETLAQGRCRQALTGNMDLIPTTTTRTPKLEVGRERRGYCKPAKRRKTVAQDTASGAMQKEVEVFTLRVRGGGSRYREKGEQNRERWVSCVCED